VPTKIGLISDVHADAAPLEEALLIFQRESVDEILCAGDISGYGEELAQSVELLVESNCKIISGNHDIWFLNTLDGQEENKIGAFFQSLPVFLEFTWDEKQLYTVHASPPFSQTKGMMLLNENEEVIDAQKEQWSCYLKDFRYDILIVGHTHQVFVEQLGDTLVINPGSTKFNHTCFILDLPDMNIRMFPLSNKTPVKAWNWGMGL